MGLIDYGRLRQDLTPLIAEAIEHLIEGSKQDIERFAVDIGQDLVIAQVTGDQPLKEQLGDQLKLLAEINNIRLRNSTWIVVSTVVSALTRAAVAGALATFSF